MWAVTVTGMICEKVVVNHWFMAKQYFWEDLGNLIAMITHNAYFVALWMGLSQREVMYVMLFAFVTYLFNLVQWALVGIRSWQQRRCPDQA
jgi:3-vinyl bacteriochlorophyllide hydratase